MKKSIGLIGLGNIGTYFTSQLLAAEYPLTVLDILPDKLQHAVDQGAQAAKTPGEVAAASDIIVLSLAGSDPVTAVMEGEDGVLAHIRPGTLVIDTGTTRPATDIHYQKVCAERGASFIDAPITWRREGLIIMVGGRQEDFSAAQEVLGVLSFKLKYIGDIGQGQRLKLLNQMNQAGLLAVFSEAVEMAKQCDLDPRLLKDFLGFPIGEDLFGNDFSGGGHLALHYKDMGYALELSHDVGAQTPIAGLVHEVFKATKPYGHPNWKQPGIITYWRRLNDPQYGE